MGKILTIIGILYVLYYAGNIIYDLFIRKDVVPVDNDNSQEFSIDDIASKSAEPLYNIEIDEVEALQTPTSFTAKQNFNVEEEEDKNSTNVDLWREKFEKEQSLEGYEVTEISNKPTDLNEIPKEVSIEPVSNEKNSSDTKITSSNNNSHSNPIPDDVWKEMLNQADTQVKMVGNKEGYKIYKNSKAI